MHDAVIILNEKHEILHINTEARNLLDLHEHRMIGKPAQQFAANNKLFQTILDTEDDLSSLKIKLDGKESVAVDGRLEQRIERGAQGRQRRQADGCATRRLQQAPRRRPGDGRRCAAGAAQHRHPGHHQRAAPGGPAVW